MTYIWSFNHGPVPAKAQFIEHGRVLILPDAQIEDAGNYTCRVERGTSAFQEKTLRLVIEGNDIFYVYSIF